jgi:hypothetical protein
MKIDWAKLNSVLFFILIFCTGILFFTLPKKLVSESEKRKLSQLPIVNLQNILSGKLEHEFDNYYDDNFILRSDIIGLANLIKENFGIKSDEIRYYNKPKTFKSKRNKSVKNIPVFDDSTKIFKDFKSVEKVDQPNEISDQEIEVENDEYQNIKSVIVFKNRAIQIFGGSKKNMAKFASMVLRYKTEIEGIKNVYCMAIPVGSDFYLPSKFSKTNEQNSIDFLYKSMDTSIHCVRAYDELSNHKNEYIQFNTDHHWTGRGAYYAYQAFCKTAGIEYLDKDKFQRKVIKNFLGTLYYYTLSKSLKENTDSVEYFKIPNQTKAYYFNEGFSNAKATKLYAEYARGGNAYGVFLGADFPLMKIVSDVKNGRKILQIKDSYGNAFAPFLSAHYEEVYIVDYRYFEGNIKELVKKYGITDIIFSHNLQVVNSSYTTFRESKMLTGHNSRIISTKKDTINTKK